MPLTSILKAALVAAISAFALLAAGARPAAAATPCWKVLLNDWYDGRIDNTYPLHCYTDALKHLPSDVKTYSSAADDIERALQSARARLRRENKNRIGPNTLIPGQGGNGKGGRNGRPGGSSGGTSTLPGRKPGGGLAGQASASSPSSIPVPLLVLGGLALLLVAAEAAGLVAKRVQGRKRPS
jgi:hypothetical protein